MVAEDFSAQHGPIEIRYKKDEKILEIDFDDGAKFRLPAELLRVESPSAEVQGHAADQKKIVPGRRHVGIIEIEPVGNYDVLLKFDDMHDTGIYSWQFLHELGQKQETVWLDYLTALAASGFSRDP